MEVNGTMGSFKLDTGPQVPILPEYDYRKLKMRPNESPRNIKITGYASTVDTYLTCDALEVILAYIFRSCPIIDSFWKEIIT